MASHYIDPHLYIDGTIYLIEVEYSWKPSEPRRQRDNINIIKA